MLVEEKKLRWWGIDMRARWCRRVAVALTYVVFLVVVWHPSSWLFGWMMALMWGAIIGSIWPSVGDADFAMQWVVKAGYVLIAGFWVYRAWYHPEGHSVSNVGWVALILLWLYSVVGLGGGLVDHGRPNWMAEAIRNGGELSWRKQRRLARRGFGIGLDGFAWYEYGMRFQRLNGEQKVEIQALRQAHPRGKWMRPQASVLFDDERLKNEEARLRARVQKVMSWVLVSSALLSSIALADGGTVCTSVVVASLWTLAAMITTLRQAMVLWMEDDPRRMAGEMAVVDGVGVL